MPACWENIRKESERGFVFCAWRERKGIEISERDAYVLCLSLSTGISVNVGLCAQRGELSQILGRCIYLTSSIRPHGDISIG